MSAPIGIFGGTFDPIHFGHLRAAFELSELVGLRKVLFIPAADPPHRGPPLRDARTRLELVRAALEDEADFEVDDRELRRPGPSYTVLTLEELRAEFGLQQSLVLLLGMDAFLGLPGWHRWQALLGLAHIAVAHRPGARPEFPDELAALVATRGTTLADDLRQAPAGRILIHPGTQLDISSTDLRAALRGGRDPRYLMPEPVRRMILATGIYALSRDAGE
ncbi:MAG: nicotinate-nucleotide adenylyltransferase [Steroidobacteraceae bacterium]